MTAIPTPYLDAIRNIHPDFTAASMRLHTGGWDSDAVEVEGFIFKFPKTILGSERLKREAHYLALIRPRVSLTVPDLIIHESPRIFSEHRMIPGATIETPQYDVLSETQRNAMAKTLGGFYADLHHIPIAEAIAVGAQNIPDWPATDKIRAAMDIFLLPEHRAWADHALDAYAALKDDDLITGYFDGHGWNMAFDHTRGVLNGLYDFADGGIGPRHRDFCYSNFISPDLTERMITHYESLTGRNINRRLVALHTTVQRLSELEEDKNGATRFRDNMRQWHDYLAAHPELQS